MGHNDVDSTGGTSSDCASGNPPVVFFSGQDQPNFLSNNQVLKNLRDAGFMDADTDEAKYLLEHVSYQHMIPYLKTAKAWSRDAGIKRASDLLSFDRLMQAVTLRFIGVIEAQMRAQYSHAMAERHGSLAIYDGSLFLREDRYMRSRESYDAEVGKLLRGEPFSTKQRKAPPRAPGKQSRGQCPNRYPKQRGRVHYAIKRTVWQLSHP